MIDKLRVDYSLYLVTDSTMLPPGTTLESQVLAALQNGVTLVQLREKETDTKVFIEQALKVQKLCWEFQVPLIINDRVDVALAIDADGVHVGQDDMPIAMVRKLVGPDKIVGWSVGYEREVEELAAMGPEGVDYIGLGMVFPTNTKKNAKKSPMGPRGVSKLLDSLQKTNATWCKTVAIGGLHPDNIPRVLYQMCSEDGKRSIDGIAVVSDIMASQEAGNAAKKLRSLIDSRSYEFANGVSDLSDVKQLSAIEETFVDTTAATSPLIHHITNKVHQNFGANVALALKSSPIMSEVAAEYKELSEVPHAVLLLNTGSVAPLENMVSAIRAYNEAKRPIVFDPVGFSATSARLVLNSHLLAYGQFACIKGNAGEILSIADLNVGKMRGVDSGDSVSDLAVIIKATRLVAYRYRCVAVCTGKVDIIANGLNAGKYELSTGSVKPSLLPAFKVESGDLEIMGRITASGCSLGTTIACLIGGITNSQNLFSAVLTAVRLYKSAGYLASLSCKGTGSFQVSLIDSLDQLLQANQPSTWKATVKAV
ncbi:LADA_0G01882g1_1 [Lachancea dasiensis]|uniref:LADA_0G01882g1_1 n=1 Tax=Lachancea dasiensis TaxID=1072105 RepID=A0A1G4JQY9_9SACH|nr:LADA_0G01882g1_1 [Lachancea dasiensis]